MVAAALASLTVTGHAGAGGGLPDLGGAVVLGVLAAGLGSAVASRRLRVLPVLALLLLGQVLGHVVLTVAGHHGAPAGPSPWLMVAAHGGAALGTAVVLVRCDRLLDRWLTLWATVLGTPAHPAALIGAAPAVQPAGAPPLVTVRVLRHLLVRRGPPAPAVLS